MMLSVSTLGPLFQNGDLDFRRRQISQYFVVKTVKHDPLRAIGVYRYLRQCSGEHAAEKFYALLQVSDLRLWYHHVAMTRPAAKPLP